MDIARSTPAAARVDPRRPLDDGVVWERALVRVLDQDPDLGSALADEPHADARRAAVAPAVQHAPGPYAFFPAPEPGAIGALVLDGLVSIRTGTGERGHIELLSAGDVISPWVVDDGEFARASIISATVLRTARLAYLDRGFTMTIGRWPELYTAIVHRLIVRARRLSFQAAVNALPRVDERLEVTLWHFADRFGRVTPRGICVDLPLTHAQIAEVAAAQRPSITTALRRLTDAGRVKRLDDGSWLLCGDPPALLLSLERQAGLGSR